MEKFPRSLANVLQHDPPTEEAWSEFAREYTTLLIHVARSVSHDRDDAMDAYAYLLERLSDDGCKRLRTYTSDPKSKFTTWLVVVARRLCVDHYRAKFGRLRDGESTVEHERLDLRRRLKSLGDGTEFVDLIADEAAPTAATTVERAELSNELNSLKTTLAPGDRLLLRLRFDDGLSAAEIAAILKLPSQFHVYRRINALLAEMKVRLNGRGYEATGL